MKRGMTLLEVIVSAVILASMAGLVLGVYLGSYGAFRRGTARMSTVQRAREVVRRVTPLVMSSIAPSPLEEAVYLPAIGASDVSIELYSADNLLQPMAPINPRSPVHYLFRIWLNNQGEVIVDELQIPSRVPMGNSKLIARNVYSLEFDRLAVNAVKLKVVTRDQIRNASGHQENLDVERSAVIAIPYYSSAR